VSYGDWAQQEAVNVTGTRQVAEAAAAQGVERLVHVSSIATYGYRRDGHFSEADPLTPTPYEPYSISKVQAEAVVREVAAARNLSFSIIRPGMIYGPRSGQWTDVLFRHATRKPIIWFGAGDGATFPIFIDDVVDMLVVLATHPTAHNETFNCVYPEATTWGEFIGAYAALTGNQSWLKLPVGPVKLLAQALGTLAPPSSRLKAAPDALHALLRQASIDMTKAQNLLGWQPQVDLAEGVQRCVPYLRERGWLK
jgi:nucleoside-diphosphate-sugar epimerase